MSNNCEICFKIVCGFCGWMPDENEGFLIQSGVLTSCPECGWKPNEDAR